MAEQENISTATDKYILSPITSLFYIDKKELIIKFAIPLPETNF